MGVDWGAFAFGLVIGWCTYFVNRYRSEVALGDVLTIIGAVGGGAVLALFPAGTALFSSYGVGLAVGFFGYLVVLAVIVRRAGWGAEWFLDGRRPKIDPKRQVEGVPGHRAMGEGDFTE